MTAGQETLDRVPKSNEPCWCGSGKKFKRCHKEGPTLGQQIELVQPGIVSPMRSVPDGIVRPDYVLNGGNPVQRRLELVKPPATIEAMRRAGKAAVAVLQAVAPHVGPGITTDELDVIAHEAYIAQGGYPSTLGYHDYPKTICTSINEVICHGIPDDRPLKDGDIVNVDVTIFLDGVHGDCSDTFLVGDVDEHSSRLVRVTKECLDLGVAAVRPGVPVNEVGRAIERHAKAFGYGVVRMFVGHGIGEMFHMQPNVPHYFDRNARTIMHPGMTFTIEPMITMGSYEVEVWEDKWTAVTQDRRRTAQFEHTVLVTDTGVEVLTPR